MSPARPVLSTPPARWLLRFPRRPLAAMADQTQAQFLRRMGTTLDWLFMALAGTVFFALVLGVGLWVFADNAALAHDRMVVACPLLAAAAASVLFLGRLRVVQHWLCVEPAGQVPGGAGHPGLEVERSAYQCLPSLGGYRFQSNPLQRWEAEAIFLLCHPEGQALLAERSIQAVLPASAPPTPRSRL